MTNVLTVVARRVGLEKIDYKQILVDKYGCYGSTLGEVRMVNGRLDIEGIVDLSSENLIKLPFKFGKVGGAFNCSYNQLTSLEGAPRKVGGGSFNCRYNNLPKDVKKPKGIKGLFFK